MSVTTMAVFNVDVLAGLLTPGTLKIEGVEPHLPGEKIVSHETADDADLDAAIATAAARFAPPSDVQPVQVDPQALTDAQAAINSATTIASLRKAVNTALNLLNPGT